MSLIKNIFKSILILVGIALLVVMSCIAIMMFGNVTIFGYKYVSYEYGAVVDSSISGFSNLSINTKGVAVEIISSNDVSKLEYSFNTKVQGVLKADTLIAQKTTQNEDVLVPIAFGEKLNSDVCEITLSEAEGLMFQNSSKLKIYLPSSMNISTLTINTGTNDIKFSGSNVLNVTNLVFNATTDLKPYTFSEKLTTQNFKLTSKSGRFYIDSQISGNVEIDSELSTIIFNKNVGNYSSDIKIAGINPMVEFGDFDDASKKVDVNSDIVVDCTNGGLIKISGNVSGTISLISPKVDLSVGRVAGQITSTDGFKNLYVKELTGNSTINKGDGNLYIGICKADNLVVNGNKNKVVIDKLYGNANIVNDYGDVTVSYPEQKTAEETTILSSRTLTVSTKQNAIKVYNICCQVTLTSERGSITTTFDRIIGNNTITTKNPVNAKVKDNLQFKLTTMSKSGKVNVDLGSANYNNWDGSETVEDYKSKTVNVNGGGASTLTIKTIDGSIGVTILD